MRDIKKAAVAAVAVAACAAASGGTLVQSTFATGAEGWKAGNGASHFAWHAVGGHPGGYVSADDSVGGKTWVFIAPDSFLGDMSAAFGGTLSYDLKSSNPGGATGESFPEVKLVGTNELTLVESAFAAPGAAWTSYSVKLAPGVWHVDSLTGALASASDLQTVLGSLSALYIRGEFSTEFDVGSLDNVTLSAPAPAVPEPEQAWLLVAGLAALAAIARTRKR